MTILNTFNFDLETTIEEARSLIVSLGGVKLPVAQETYVVEGFDDNGSPIRTFYRKSSPTGYHATEMAA